MCPCVGVARGHVQHPELEAGRPSLKLGLGWSQGAAAEQKVACYVERCRVPIVGEHTGRGTGRHCKAGRAGPSGGLESTIARRFLRGSSRRTVSFGSRLRTPASSCSTSGMAQVGPIWPAYRGPGRHLKF